MTYWEERGQRLLARLQADPSNQVHFIETADIGYLILALLERIQRLEEAQQHGKRQEQSE